MSFCFKCGNEIDENIEFCPYCGTNQKGGMVDNENDDKQLSSSRSNQSNSSLNRKKNNKIIILIIIGVVLILSIIGCVLYFFVFNNNNEKDKSSDNKSTSNYIYENSSNTSKTDVVDNSQKEMYETVLSESVTDMTDDGNTFTARYPKGFTYIEGEPGRVQYGDSKSAIIDIINVKDSSVRRPGDILNEIKSNASYEASDEVIDGNTLSFNVRTQNGELRYYYYMIYNDVIYGYVFKHNEKDDYHRIIDSIVKCANAGELIVVK